jgi:hypothetical protein
MLGFVTQAAQKFADSTEQVVADSANYGPVGTTMALLEASSKFFSAIHKRLHKSQRDEFKLLSRINHEYLPEEFSCDVPNGTLKIYREDFDGRIDVIPVSDPNIPSNAHRMMMAQMALQLSQSSPPGMFNIEELNRTILMAANIPNLENIMPRKPEPIPLDPISDIAAAVKGLPIKAFVGQNHTAHAQAKTMYLQDPMNGANPVMQRIAPVLQANIQEHMIMQYQEQVNGVAQQMVQTNPELAQQSQQDNKVMEMVLLQAAQQVMQANQAMAAQQQAGSPEAQMVQLEAKRIEVEQSKIQAMMAKESTNSMLKEKELAIKEAEVKMSLLKNTITTSSTSVEKGKDRDMKLAIAKMSADIKATDIQSKSVVAQNLKAADVMTSLVKEQTKRKL